jgi:sporulation protein YlmC with PRC-barrel domain
MMATRDALKEASMPSPTHPAHEWHGLDVLDEGGEKVGTVDDVYVDDHSGDPEFILLRGGLFGLRKHFAPIRGASREDEAIRLAYPADLVRDAPSIAADEHLTIEEEERLHAYYGIDYVRPAVGTLRLRSVIITQIR